MKKKIDSRKAKLAARMAVEYIRCLDRGIPLEVCAAIARELANSGLRTKRKSGGSGNEKTKYRTITKGGKFLE